MKTFTVTALIFSACIDFNTQAKPVPVAVISINSDIFYFKVDKTFIGATVTVYSPIGDVILSEKVNKHKAIIDFYDGNAGRYTIVVKKDTDEVDFVYEKYDSASDLVKRAPSITLVQ